MDADRFDGLARSLIGRASRRRILRALLASALGTQSLAQGRDARAKPGKGKAKGHSKGKAKGKAKGHGKSGGQGTAGGVVPPQGGSATPSTAAPTLPGAAECSLPAESCDGCCLDGQCLPGTDHRACGHAGSACHNCTAQAMLCTASRECGCDPESCAGCCVAGSCQGGDHNDACGRGGIACHPCPTGYVCRQGVCCGEEGAGTTPGSAELPYAPACCDGLLADPAGICRRGCAGLGCQDRASCEPCRRSSGGALDSCLDGRCCLASGPCPCEAGDGPCRDCCSGTCEQGQCRHDCARMGCPDGGECCPSTGECYSRDRTNCRRGDGRLVQCEAGYICCQAPDGDVECGRNGHQGCPASFVSTLPAACPDRVAQPGAADRS